MSKLGKFAIREAAEVSFFDIETGDLLVTLDTLKQTEINTTSATEYARGGRGNPRLVGFSGDKEATMTIQDALFDPRAMALLTGNDVTSTTENVFFRKKMMTTPTTLKEGMKIPEDLTEVVVYKDNEIVEDGFSVEGGVFKVTDEDIGNGVSFIVTGRTDKSATSIHVTSDAFPGTYRIVADVLVRDASTGKDYAAQLTVPKGKVEDDFSFSFAPEGDPSVMDIPVEILKDTYSEDMWTLHIFDEEEVD